MTAIALTPVSRWSRIYGLGSVYAKTLRDSRLAFLIVAGLTGVTVFGDTTNSGCTAAKDGIIVSD